MDWLQNLFTGEKLDSAYRAAIFFCDCSGCKLLGKIKIFVGIVRCYFVLFTGIVCGHFRSRTGNTQILTFLQDFGLILFVFCIGLQVGPSFFSSFKKGGDCHEPDSDWDCSSEYCSGPGLYYGLNGRIELPMMVGILCGAVTNTPGLGAANEA